LKNKVLDKWDSMAISLGIVIGVGIFRVPADVAKYLPGAGPLILLAWFVGGLISLSGAFCYAELAAMYPDTGGDYAFLRRGYGKLAAFLYAWSELLIIRTGSIAAISYLFSDYACGLFSLDKSMSKPLAIVVVILLGALNILGLSVGRRVQNALSLTKVAAIVLLIFCALLSGQGDISRLTTGPVETPSLSLLSSFALVLIPILWTYGGWQENVFVAGETKDAGKNLPFALTGTVLVVSSLYIFLNAIFLYLIPTETMANSKLIAADVLSVLYGGQTSSKVLEALVVIYAIGSINAMIITGSRVTYAMAQDVPLFKLLASEKPEATTPIRALAVNVVGACIFVILGSFDRLLFFTGIVVWLFFALVATTLFVFRRRSADHARPFVVPFYPYLPAIFIFACLALCLNTFCTFPQQSLFGLGLVASGVPVFYLSHHLANIGVLKP
jgi:basic amino acid/polyamine antiporter, APA family